MQLSFSTSIPNDDHPGVNFPLPHVTIYISTTFLNSLGAAQVGSPLQTVESFS